jgi:phosphoglycolate phosphatase-like HAD superfamily hydrolase
MPAPSRSLRVLAVLLAIGAGSALGAATRDEADPLPSWNDGPAKHAILDLVRATTDQTSPQFVRAEERVATFDQDGTLWVEQPMYTQVLYALARVPAVVAARPDLARAEPFKTVLAGDRTAIARLSKDDLGKIVAAALSGMSVERFTADVRKWLATARDQRFGRRYTELAYKPMVELLAYLRARGFKTYIVTGSGQDFVRAYAQEVYGVPPEQVVGSASAASYGYDTIGRPVLTKQARVLLEDDGPGKPEGIHLMIGRRPVAAFGNAAGDRQMLEYTKAGDGARLALLVLHDDPLREYAYGPAAGFPDTRVGAMPQALYDQARRQGWIVVSMKAEWKHVFAFDGLAAR